MEPAAAPLPDEGDSWEEEGFGSSPVKSPGAYFMAGSPSPPPPHKGRRSGGRSPPHLAAGGCRRRGGEPGSPLPEYPGTPPHKTFRKLRLFDTPHTPKVRRPRPLPGRGGGRRRPGAVGGGRWAGGGRLGGAPSARRSPGGCRCRAGGGWGARRAPCCCWVAEERSLGLARSRLSAGSCAWFELHVPEALRRGWEAGQAELPLNRRRWEREAIGSASACQRRAAGRHCRFWSRYSPKYINVARLNPAIVVLRSLLLST